MNTDKITYISVIITAYNRKEYLLNAIKSVINQTLNKKYYEIIVIKNYNDNIIDDFINKNNIKNIFSNDKTLSGKLVEALKIANGNIISFLEDDDLFADNKLEILYNKFKNNDNLVYYHNDNIPVNDKYEILNINRNKYITFNMSSISVRKSIININNLKKVIINQDHFMYLCALESNKKIIKGKEKLTYYMYHNNSISHNEIKNFEEFKNHRIKLIDPVLSNLSTFKEIFTSKNVINYINAKITYVEMECNFYGINKKPDNLINFFKNNFKPLHSRIKIFMAYLLIRMHNNFSNHIINKLWNNYRKNRNIKD